VPTDQPSTTLLPLRRAAFLRGGGRVALTVTAELVYVGTREELEKRAAGARGE
jgi:hypothetical protein